MEAPLQTWKRFRSADSGGQPFLFYVIFGDIDWSESLSRQVYRCDGPPDGIDLMSYGSDSHPEVPGSFCEGWSWDEFVARDPQCAARVGKCGQCIVLRGTPTNASTLNYLRDVIGLITYMLDHGGCAVHDLQRLHWWNPTEWKRRIFDPGEPVPRQHTVLLVSEEPDPSLKWYHTRGMRQFGRPDISVHNVPDTFAEGVIELCNRLIEHQARGAILEEGQEVHLATLPPGGVIRHGGDLENPDFNNVHVEVSWPAGGLPAIANTGGF